MRRWHRFFFVNRRRMQNFIAAGAIDSTSDAPRLVGMPKVDCLVDGSLRRDDILSALDLDPARPTVLYAPTWSAASSLNLMGVELVGGLLARSWNVIVKLHDRSRDPRPFYSGGVDWAASAAERDGGQAGIPRRRRDICPYLAAADVMITDHSSAGFEYLLLDRPLVRIHVPELLRGSNISEEYVRLLADAARSVDRPVEALQAVEEGLADPKPGSASRRAVAATSSIAWERHRARGRELYEAMELRAGCGDGSRRPGGGDLMILDVILPTFNREALLAPNAGEPASPRGRHGLKVRVSWSTTRRRTDERSSSAASRPPFGTAAFTICSCRRRASRYALNAGIAATGGDLIGLIDDDEEVDARWFESIWRHFARASRGSISSAASVCRSGARRGRHGSARLSRRDWLGRSGRGASGHGRYLSRAS